MDLWWQMLKFYQENDMLLSAIIGTGKGIPLGGSGEMQLIGTGSYLKKINLLSFASIEFHILTAIKSIIHW